MQNYTSIDIDKLFIYDNYGNTGGIGIVKLLTQDNYGNIGYLIVKYLFLRDLRNLREVCTELCSILFREEIFITPTKLRRINQFECPRLYEKVQNSNPVLFQRVPLNVIVKNMRDIQK